MKSTSIIKVCLLLCTFLLCNCSANGPAKIIIFTEYGDIEMELYDKTPQHRDNFIKLVKEGYYDGTLFHRVIWQFMIQGGDPDTKHARPGVRLGNGGPGYTIPAEFVPELIHKRGALAAARQSDNINPAKASSGSQFYIVQGKVFSDDDIVKVEKEIGQKKAHQMFLQYTKEEEDAMQKAGLTVAPDSAQSKAAKRALAYLRENPYHITDEARQIYKSIGGAPHLDGEYTVFGQVTKGMDVVDKIAEVETDEAARPKVDVRILKIVVK